MKKSKFISNSSFIVSVWLGYNNSQDMNKYHNLLKIIANNDGESDWEFKITNTNRNKYYLVSDSYKTNASIQNLIKEAETIGIKILTLTEFNNILAKEKEEEEKENMKNANIAGKTFCFTGAMSKPRKELEKQVRDAGGLTSSNMSKKVDYLVYSEKFSTKYCTAVDYGTNKLTEKEFHSLFTIPPSNNNSNCYHFIHKKQTFYVGEKVIIKTEYHGDKLATIVGYDKDDKKILLQTDQEDVIMGGNITQTINHFSKTSKNTWQGSFDIKRYIDPYETTYNSSYFEKHKALKSFFKIGPSSKFELVKTEQPITDADVAGKLTNTFSHIENKYKDLTKDQFVQINTDFHGTIKGVFLGKVGDIILLRNFNNYEDNKYPNRQLFGNTNLKEIDEFLAKEYNENLTSGNIICINTTNITSTSPSSFSKILDKPNPSFKIGDEVIIQIPLTDGKIIFEKATVLKKEGHYYNYSSYAIHRVLDENIQKKLYDGVSIFDNQYDSYYNKSKTNTTIVKSVYGSSDITPSVVKVLSSKIETTTEKVKDTTSDKKGITANSQDAAISLSQDEFRSLQETVKKLLEKVQQQQAQAQSIPIKSVKPSSNLSDELKISIIQELKKNQSELLQNLTNLNIEKSQNELGQSLSSLTQTIKNLNDNTVSKSTNITPLFENTSYFPFKKISFKTNEQKKLINIDNSNKEKEIDDAINKMVEISQFSIKDTNKKLGEEWKKHILSNNIEVSNYKDSFVNYILTYRQIPIFEENINSIVEAELKNNSKATGEACIKWKNILMYKYKNSLDKPMTPSEVKALPLELKEFINDLEKLDTKKISSKYHIDDDKAVSQDRVFDLQLQLFKSQLETIITKVIYTHFNDIKDDVAFSKFVDLYKKSQLTNYNANLPLKITHLISESEQDYSDSAKDYFNQIVKEHHIQRAGIHLKEEIKKAGYRSLTDNAVWAFQTSLSSVLKNSEKAKIVDEIFQSELGEAILRTSLGYFATHAFESKNTHIDTIAEELRISGLTCAGNMIAELVKDFIQPAISSILTSDQLEKSSNVRIEPISDKKISEPTSDKEEDGVNHKNMSN